ncbi:MAG: Clp1/GlmU family protein [candidate division KSB1 bacterium]|nr:Clp1/GlmU family protein [candidate division KSB1 bacterium]MDZ7319848.1 Clp1/GlmU family protein [candidate division KSB1 bacterium]MDZ7341998.1 Clp1/GlmU family protein [candidate division KSB1 bacterium]
MISIDERWPQLLEELQQGQVRKIVYVMGANDSGKTTFCRYLQEALAIHFPTAYIDGDPGQSQIGPPTTLGLQFTLPPPVQPKRCFLRFVGATTPRGHLLPTLAGIRKLTERAIQAGALRIIVDSCGFVLEPPARELHFYLIDMIRPDHLIVFDSTNEVMKWARYFQRIQQLNIHQLPVGPAVTLRSAEERRAYREEKFKNYFASARMQSLRLRGYGFHGRIPDLHRPETFRQRLIAFCDAENWVLGLGLIEAMDWEQRVMKVLAPPFDASRLAFIIFGSIHLNQNGQQIFPKVAVESSAIHSRSNSVPADDQRTMPIVSHGRE